MTEVTEHQTNHELLHWWYRCQTRQQRPSGRYTKVRWWQLQTQGLVWASLNSQRATHGLLLWGHCSKNNYVWCRSHFGCEGQVDFYILSSSCWIDDQKWLESIYNFKSENLPDVTFFNNNCHLQEHLHKEKDSFLWHIILAVDVFHFKSKHKETDIFCQKHCNLGKS